MADANEYSPVSGVLLGADGQTYDLVTLLGGGQGGETGVDPAAYSPRGARIVGADGKVYDLVALIKNAVNGSVRLDEDQALTDEQKASVLQKLGVGQLVAKTGNNLAPDAAWDYGYYYNTTGRHTANAAFSCARIAVAPGDTILFSGFMAADNASASAFSPGARVQFWLAGTFVSAPVNNLSSALRGYELAVPAGVDSATFTVWFNTLEDIQANVDIRLRRSVCEISVDSRNVKPGNLTGKRWASYGDSITYRNSWQPYLAEKYGLVHTNLGVGSTCIANRGSNPMCSDARLQAIMDANPDVATILGGANDLTYVDAGSISLGTAAELDKALADKDRTTFYGAYGFIIETLLAWKPTLRIVILGMYYAHANGATYSQSVRYSDFSEAAREIARHYSLPFVDLHGESGFNAFTMGTARYAVYSTDRIHPNAEGGKRIAECVDPVFARLFSCT